MNPCFLQRVSALFRKPLTENFWFRLRWKKYQKYSKPERLRAVKKRREWSRKKNWINNKIKRYPKKKRIQTANKCFIGKRNLKVRVARREREDRMLTLCCWSRLKWERAESNFLRTSGAEGLKWLPQVKHTQESYVAGCPIFSRWCNFVVRFDSIIKSRKFKKAVVVHMCVCDCDSIASYEWAEFHSHKMITKFRYSATSNVRAQPICECLSKQAASCCRQQRKTVFRIRKFIHREQRNSSLFTSPRTGL